jgi:hypothetical protein
MTFDECRDGYKVDHEKTWSAAHRRDWLKMMKNHITPVCGTTPVAMVDTPLVLKVIKPIWTTKHPTARRFTWPRTRLSAAVTRSAFPNAPAPLAPSDRDGMELAREEARRYLPNLVRLFAGIELAPDSEAALHTRMMCGKSLMEISGVIPQATPSPPPPHPYERPVDGPEPD